MSWLRGRDGGGWQGRRALQWVISSPPARPPARPPQVLLREGGALPGLQRVAEELAGQQAVDDAVAGAPRAALCSRCNAGGGGCGGR